MSAPPGQTNNDGVPGHVREVLARPLSLALTTLNVDGSPHVSLVWQELQGDDVVFFCDKASRKAKNLRRDGRIAGVVVDDVSRLGDGVPCYLTVSGTAELLPREDTLVQRLTARYMGLDNYPFGDLAPFIVVRIRSARFGGNLPMDRREGM